jgi:hypothetical protein
MNTYALADTASTAVCVSELCELLGEDVLLLHWPLGSKGTNRKWGHLTIEVMNDPAYLETLGTGNVGVALGAKSGGLVAVDIDEDELVQPFLDANPSLADTLQTHGARGRVFWLRMVGDYPQRTVTLKTRNGEEAGEWRAGTNSQSIIAGIHPNGQPYRMLVEAPPLAVRFASIRWPAEIVFPAQTPQPNQNRGTTLRSHRLTSVPIGSHLFTYVTSLKSEQEAMVQASEPHSRGQNHHLLFELARRVKGMEQRTGTSLTMEELRAILNRWLELAVEFLRPGQSADEYFFEFLAALECVKYPVGERVLEAAWQRACASEPPPEAAAIESPDIRRLVCLCRELQLSAGKRPFILPARTVQGLFHHHDHIKGWRWLEGLCRMKILCKVKAGNSARREVNEYRYLPAHPKPKSKTIL